MGTSPVTIAAQRRTECTPLMSRSAKNPGDKGPLDPSQLQASGGAAGRMQRLDRCPLVQQRKLARSRGRIQNHVSLHSPLPSLRVLEAQSSMGSHFSPRWGSALISNLLRQSWAHVFEVTRDDRERCNVFRRSRHAALVRMSLERLMTQAGLGGTLARIAAGGSARQTPEPLVTIVSQGNLLGRLWHAVESISVRCHLLRSRACATS